LSAAAALCCWSGAGKFYPHRLPLSPPFNETERESEGHERRALTGDRLRSGADSIPAVATSKAVRLLYRLFYINRHVFLSLKPKVFRPGIKCR
jgi:hypothetical protein